MIKSLLKNILDKASAYAVSAEQNAENYTDTSITEQTTYSTTEQAVGTWIDGKTVYRRVFNSTLGSGASTIITTDSSVLLPNVVPIKVEGRLYSAANNTSIDIGTYLNTSYYCGTWWTNNAITIYNSSNVSGWQCRMIIYYAK